MLGNVVVQNVAKNIRIYCCIYIALKLLFKQWRAVVSMEMNIWAHKMQINFSPVKQIIAFQGAVQSVSGKSSNPSIR
jgi:hypothetical protein